MEKNTQKQILEAMLKGEQYKVNHFDDRFTKTDFTPKKKPSIKQKLKNGINTFFTKIKKNKITLAIKNWYKNTISEPIKNKKAKKEHDKYIKELKKNFSEKFNIDVDKTIKIMSEPGYSPLDIDNNKLLIENRLEINRRKSLYRFSPFNYDVDIVDIHNENLNNELPPLHEVMTNESDEAKKLIDKQHNFFLKRPELTKGQKKTKPF